MKPELIDIFNDRMEPIGIHPRKDVHKNGFWHKAFHCWIVSRDREGNEYLVFQLRSKEKDILPNSLDISAAGHLQAGESPLDGVRELNEELGIELEEDELKFLGIHVEVYCDDRQINREFDYAYFLREDKDILSYIVQPSEVTGLTKVLISDGIKLFSKEVGEIECYSVLFDETGKPVDQGFYQKLHISSFAGGERNNYFIKVFLLAKQYFAGEELLFI